MAARTNPDSFLDEFSPMSEALIATTQVRNQTAAAITSFFITIGTEKCFKPFASRFFKGIGNIRVSAALDEIRGMETFRNVHSFAHDISDKMSIAEIKEISFLEVVTTFQLCGIIAYWLKWNWIILKKNLMTVMKCSVRFFKSYLHFMKEQVLLLHTSKTK